jgi:mitochondrial fission protein ELM1
MAPPAVWVLADDRPGNANQAIGVAEALEWPFETKRIAYGPLARLPNLLLGARLAGLARIARQSLQSPWPDIVIAAGRRTAPVARWIRRQRPDVFLVQLMWPGSVRGLDLVVVPEHDECPAHPKLVPTLGTPHRVTPTSLARARTGLAATLAHLPRPHVVGLVGGASRHAPFTPRDASALAWAAAGLATARGGSVLLSTSRRTGAAAEEALEELDLPAPVWLHRFSSGGENPYLGLLGHADAIFVTADSASMVTEACATGRPVFLVRPAGWRGGKLERLHSRLERGGHLHDPGAGWPGDVAAPLLPQDEVARVIRQRLGSRRSVVASPPPSN